MFIPGMASRFGASAPVLVRYSAASPMVGPRPRYLTRAWARGPTSCSGWPRSTTCCLARSSQRTTCSPPLTYVTIWLPEVGVC